MNPMIRVDDEVYDYLNKKGRTEDSFNDVIRRELKLGPRKPSNKDIRKESMNTAVIIPKDIKATVFESALNRFLPPHWADTPRRRDQILEVVHVYLATPANWSTSEREVYAAKKIAQKRGIEVNTVQDKCGRQLYGEGNLIEQFRAALEGIEAYLKKPVN